MSVRIINADVFDGLAQLEDESVHCVCTSPPYWGLRDYGVDGQIGLEPTLSEHIKKMVDVFAEVHRVLRKDGTLWINYGDCYASSVNGRSAADTKALGNDDRTFRDKPFSTVGPIYRGKRMERGSGRWGGGNSSSPELKPKDLAMVPNRLAIALQEWGWWVRSEIIWFKPNPMPESIKDRPTSAHEKIWLLTKAQRYFYDAEAVREDRTQDEDANGFRGGSYVGGEPSSRAMRGNKRSGWNGSSFISAQDVATKPNLGQGPRNERPGRNVRNVWEIATEAFPEAHFVTFPCALAERCIKAGCPIGGTVLDPFGGAGTTGLVADKLGRNAVLIELNPEYAAMAERRIQNSAPLFAQVASSKPEDTEQMTLV